MENEVFSLGTCLTDTTRARVSRALLFRSLGRLQYDDWIMGIFITGSYTVLMVALNVVHNTGSNLLPPGFDFSTLTDKQTSDRIHGSKFSLVAEQMQISVVWGCKTCLLLLYHRLTQAAAPKSNLAIKILAVYIAFGFVIMELLYFTAWCRPFHHYWALITETPQCNALINHRITNAVFNISSDIIMLCIALSLFARSLLPLKRKLVLYGVFSIGIFAIIAAVLNKYYSFTNPYKQSWVTWYCREASTAIIVANLPFTWTLLRRLFSLGAFDEQHPPPPTYHSSRTAGGRRNTRVHHSSHGSGESHGKQSHNQGSKGSHAMSLIGSISSEEAVQTHDFAIHASDKDLECGLPGPSSRGEEHGMKPGPAGTGVYTPSTPRRAHFSASSGHRQISRPASRASDVPRPTSPAPTQSSVNTHRGTHIPGEGKGSGGGGRSAADRRKRARMSA